MIKLGNSKDICYQQPESYLPLQQVIQERLQTYDFHVTGQRREQVQLESSSSLNARLKVAVARRHLGNTLAASRRILELLDKNLTTNRRHLSIRYLGARLLHPSIRHAGVQHGTLRPSRARGYHVSQ
jgi:hypothetical protein